MGEKDDEVPSGLRLVCVLAKTFLIFQARSTVEVVALPGFRTWKIIKQVHSCSERKTRT